MNLSYRPLPNYLNQMRAHRHVCGQGAQYPDRFMMKKAIPFLLFFPGVNARPQYSPKLAANQRKIKPTTIGQMR